MGFYRVSILGGISIIIVLVVLKKIEEKYITKASTIKLKVKYKSKQEAIREIQESIQGYQVNVEGIEVISDDECIYTLRKSRLVEISEIVSILSENKNIIIVIKLDITSGKKEYQNDTLFYLNIIY